MEKEEVKSGLSFIRLWKARDELSVKNIRLDYWTAWLLFPLAIILSDIRFLDQEMTLGGIDSVELIMIAYAVGWLICSFFPAKALQILMRVCAVVAALTLPAQIMADQGLFRLINYLIFHTAMGICVACGFYVFIYTLHNAERFFSLVFIIIYYCTIDMFWYNEGYSDFMKIPGTLIFMLVFIIVAFVGRSGNFPVKIIQKGDIKKGCYIVFFIYLIFFTIDLTNMYIDYDIGYSNGLYTGIGGIISIITALLVQMIFNKSVWHLWNIFLMLSIVGSALFLLEGKMPEITGSLIYGTANNIGYFAVIYMMGGAGKRNGSLLFFRIACVVTFLINSVLGLGFDHIYSNIKIDYNILVFAIILIAVCICILLIPILYKKLFDTDWSDGFRQLNMPEYEEHAAAVDELDKLKDLGLTTREREIFILLLTDDSPKMIAGKLKISSATVNFHTNNLYRKLNIQSRTQLFADYSHMIPK